MNFKAKKKMLSMFLLGNMVLSHLPHASAEMHAEGDKLKATCTVNMRLNNDLSGTRIASIKEENVARRILHCDNGWDLISYDNHLGFVKSEYFEDISDENIYDDIEFTEMHTFLQTTEKVNMRLGPGMTNDAIASIKAYTVVEVLAYANNNWYLVNYGNKLGFVCGDFLTDDYVKEEKKETTKKVVEARTEVNIRERPSAKSNRLNILYEGDIMDYLGTYNSDWYIVDYYGQEAYVNSNYVDLVDYAPVNFLRVIEITNDTNLLGSASYQAPVIGSLDKYETGEVLSDEGDFYFIKTLDQKGYVSKLDTKSLSGLFVVVDISEQKLIIYENNEIVLTTNIVSGYGDTPTPLGDFQINHKEKDYYISKYDCPVDYWMPFYGDNAFHDYNMNGLYGGKIYRKKKSHGCIRLQKVPAGKIYHLVRKGTKVVIHK